MNCKQGDLAIVVRSSAGNEGKIVEVIAPLGDAPITFGPALFFLEGEGFCWLVKSAGSPIKTVSGKNLLEAPMRDSCLRPIRPGSLDETTDTDLKLKEPA